MRAMTANYEVRPAAVAGLFYPRSPTELVSALDTLLAGQAPAGHVPKALIVPHAGYIYSGIVAGHAFRSLKACATPIERVVLFGPSHREWFHGLAVPRVQAFATPLGIARIDEAAVGRVAALPAVIASDAAHAREHSLEVQVPFLQRLLPDAPIVPVLVGETTAAEVEAALEALWGGPETLIVVSSDLSHYHSYEEAQSRDGATVGAILAARATLTGEDACGCLPINGLLRVTRRRGLRAELIDLRNSGDTAGDRDRVVGYGAFGFYDA